MKMSFEPKPKKTLLATDGHGFTRISRTAWLILCADGQGGGQSGGRSARQVRPRSHGIGHARRLPGRPVDSNRQAFGQSKDAIGGGPHRRVETRVCDARWKEEAADRI